MDLPFLICKSKVVHNCEKCGNVMILVENGQRIQLGEFSCTKCGHPFKVEQMPDGTVGIILSPIVPEMK